MLAPDVPFTIKFEVWGKDWERRYAVDRDGAPVEMLQVDLGVRKEVKIRLSVWNVIGSRVVATARLTLDRAAGARFDNLLDPARLE